MMRLFTCEPYRVRMTTDACASRYKVTRAAAEGSSTRMTQSHCAGCAVGACHVRGQDAPGVEYEQREMVGMHAAASARSGWLPRHRAHHAQGRHAAGGGLST